jgi:hypothetical protein
MIPYPKIFAIGDSHSGTFAPWAVAKSLGPETMYLMGTSDRHRFDNHITYLLERNDISRDGFWVFCLGEIDVRCHIHKQVVEKGRDEDEVISTLATNFIEKIKTMHTDVGVMSVVPPAAVEDKMDKVTHIVNSPYPFIGSDEERSRYTRKLNIVLKKLCDENDLLYFDIYSLYSDEDGFLLQEYADGDLIHISNRDKVGELLNSIETLQKYRG